MSTMRGTPQPAVNSRTIELLERLLVDLPEDLESLAAIRRRVTDASAAFDPAHDPLAASLQRCISTLRTRSESARKSGSPAAAVAEAVPGPAFHARDTMAVPEPSPPPVPPPTPHEAVAAAEPGSDVHWDPIQRMLYEDVVRLFDLGDSAGAMISLERLVMLSPTANELNIFLEKNGDLLLRLYRDALGSMDRVPVPVKDRRPLKIPTDHPALFLDVLRHADGHRTLRDLVRKLAATELRTLIVISHLARSGFVEIA
jgi:hypothetical protein